jgi:hypothetical protein
VENAGLVTGTLTLDLKPIPDHDNLIIRLDNRIESSSNADMFLDRDWDATDSWFTTALGVVVHSG